MDSDTTAKIRDLSDATAREFSAMLRYIWRSPTLIAQEKSLEASKIEQYFPESPDMAMLRWTIATNELSTTFPRMIATGNLFAALSMLESSMLLLCDILQSNSGRDIRSENGSGINRLFAYLKALGYDPAQVMPYDQVRAALTIRNCLMHANGLLSWAREHQAIREIVSKRTHLDPKTRSRCEASGYGLSHVRLDDSPLGERLVIENLYVHTCCGYLRDYFVSICKRVMGDS